MKFTAPRVLGKEWHKFHFCFWGGKYKLPVCAIKVPKSCRAVDPNFTKTEITNTDCIETPEKAEILGTSLFPISF